jgi:squalene-hopene/tetraprenyl-beta-curcumene cyclase
MSTVNAERLEAAYQTALAALLKERHPDGYWVGELSTSALSTATAIMALHLVHNEPGSQAEDNPHQPLIDGGLRWLADHQNADGGWGDTTKSFSNIATTMLCRAAIHMTGAAPHLALALSRAATWLFSKYGDTPAQLAEAVRRRYGKDRTFATPILTTCALAALVDWNEVPPLPFELAVFPQSWFRFLRLHVVSYALPALIAIGQCIYHHKKPRNPLTRFFRWLSRKRSLRVLERIQPSSGGFLEAIPLTSFVTLSLAASGLAHHAVAKNGVQFLVNAVRPDGSWAIDSNLATWVTTLAINALDWEERWKLDRLQSVLEWIANQQNQSRHAFTGANAGGWGWTDLPGSVPDADDTSGATKAITGGHLNWCNHANPLRNQMNLAVRWLLDLQNEDGGWPTFCRGWGKLPFDRSGPDLTAHALRSFANYAIPLYGDDLLTTPRTVNYTNPLERRNVSEITSAYKRGFQYLKQHQRPDGSWLPLWFGNQHTPDDENPTYGTARVLAAYRDLGMMDSEPAQRGVAWLLSVQNADGGWGGAKDTPSSMEETALAVEILLDADPRAHRPMSTRVESQLINQQAVASHRPPSCASATPPRPRVSAAVERGLAYLVARVETDGLYNPSPIGFYFAKLWYYEKLYPIIFTLAALGRARRLRNQEQPTL